VACGSRITQEDLLCGMCRGGGCNAAAGIDGSGPCAHVRIKAESIKFSFSSR
jgi:hypothetical protein